MKHATILDIGSSKIVCLCGSLNSQEGIVVHGAGIGEYSGYRYQSFQDIGQLSDAVACAVQSAEKECRFRLREVAIVAPAPFSVVKVGHAMIEIKSRQGRITGADIDMLINESLPEEQTEGYALMHSTPVSFGIDGMKELDLPIGQSAQVLEGTISHMYVRQEFMQTMQEALQGIGVQAQMYVGASLAEAMFLIPQEERVRGTILVDVGYTHTDVSMIENMAVIQSETLEVGGMHFANDLHIGLEIPLGAAEQLKRRYVFSLDYHDSVELLRTKEGTKRIERSVIQYILEERAKEFAYLLGDVIFDMTGEARRPTVYLTGGGLSMMRGSEAFLETALGMRVRCNMPWMPRMSSPNYASTFGALDFVIRADGEEPSGKRQATEQGGRLKKMKDFFVK